jgi:protein-tyrosine-phosphatase
MLLSMAGTSNQQKRPLHFLRLVGHPLRWRLLTELARSDRMVNELIRLTGESQSLVSYHLGQLRAHHLVRARSSAADHRDSYYSADLGRLEELFSEAGTELHPALRLLPPRLPLSFRTRPRVLFLCTGNSARSQIAEAFLEDLTDRQVETFSAGSHPKTLHPHAVRVMAARGIDISGRRAKHLNEFAGRRFDVVVTLCDRVREVCPEYAGAPEMLHWSVPDPARDGDADEKTYAAFERTAAEVQQRVRFLVHRLSRISPAREGN